MAKRTDNTALKEAGFLPYGQMFERFKTLASEYGGLSPAGLIDSFRAVAGFGSLYTANPYVQNTRIKGISTRPASYTKQQVADMIEHPEANEKPLRAVEHGLEYTAYPLQHIRWTYQNLLTYKSYIAPEFADRETANRDDFWREWALL
jgi:hypothetical protein